MMLCGSQLCKSITLFSDRVLSGSLFLAFIPCFFPCLLWYHALGTVADVLLWALLADPLHGSTKKDKRQAGNQTEMVLAQFCRKHHARLRMTPVLTFFLDWRFSMLLWLSEDAEESSPFDSCNQKYVKHPGCSYKNT